VVVSVKDNGIGFTEEQKKMIFQQFEKIERYQKYENILLLYTYLDKKRFIYKNFYNNANLSNLFLSKKSLY